MCDVSQPFAERYRVSVVEILAPQRFVRKIGRRRPRRLRPTLERLRPLSRGCLSPEGPIAVGRPQEQNIAQNLQFELGVRSYPADQLGRQAQPTVITGFQDCHDHAPKAARGNRNSHSHLLLKDTLGRGSGQSLGTLVRRRLLAGRAAGCYAEA